MAETEPFLRCGSVGDLAYWWAVNMFNQTGPPQSLVLSADLPPAAFSPAPWRLSLHSPLRVSAVLGLAFRRPQLNVMQMPRQKAPCRLQGSVLALICASTPSTVRARSNRNCFLIATGQRVLENQ